MSPGKTDQTKSCLLRQRRSSLLPRVVARRLPWKENSIGINNSEGVLLGDPGRNSVGVECVGNDVNPG
ncbi:MAG: hypothetical protein MI923_25460 [Phycisphaerales bacterium]|nr:hypothetical protein [Phycisphaerales bacterium]